MLPRPHIRKLNTVPRFRMLSRGRSTPVVTAIKTIKPEVKPTKEQEENNLRAQLQKEIELRSKKCEHRAFECTQPVLSGKEYCARHIMDDSSAPYKQCGHIYHNGDRCPLPAPTTQPHDNRRDQGLCFEHARVALHSRQRNAAPPPPVITTERLLSQLQHYVRPERARTTSCASSVSVVSDPTEQEQPGAPQAVDPFKQIDATAVNAAVSSNIMEFASDTDSDADSITLGRGGGARPCPIEDLPDDTNLDIYPLRYAGTFTAEEAVSEAKNALTMLQTAYTRQMRRLRVLLHEARAQYVRSLRAEKEQYCSISTQARSAPLTVRERQQLRKLKSLASYHRRHGVDAVLARKLHHKRAKINDSNPVKIPLQRRCIFSEGGVRCEAHVLPASKQCLKHILYDNQQVLFVACGDDRGVSACREPLARLPFATLSCPYHTDPPPYTIFTLTKDSDSESDSQEPSEWETNEEIDRSMEDHTDVPPDSTVY